MKPQDFFTRARANAGRKVNLPAPDGSMTQEWLHILHTQSDAYRKASTETMQQAVELAAMQDREERAKRLKEVELELLACLVTGWSFDEPFSRDGVIELFREAPYIRDYIDRKAAESVLFFGSESSSSSSTPSQPPDSNADSKTADHSANT